MRARPGSGAGTREPGALSERATAWRGCSFLTKHGDSSASWDKLLSCCPGAAMPIASVNPATGETVRTFEAHGLGAIDEMLNRPQEAFLAWRKRPLAERTRVVDRAAQLLGRRREELGPLMPP